MVDTPFLKKTSFSAEPRVQTKNAKSRSRKTIGCNAMFSYDGTSRKHSAGNAENHTALVTFPDFKQEVHT